MKRENYLTIIIMMFMLPLVGCTNNFTDPSLSITITDLEGVWIAHYGSGMNDTLILNSNGTFNQIFENSREKYIFDSGWNQWTLEKLPKGFVRLHLQGGRYYLAGISLGEASGRNDPENPCLGTNCTWGLEPRLFYDPFADEIVQMVDELLLIVQVDSTNSLVLHHVWTSSDRGFALIGGCREIFYRETNVVP